MTPNPGPAPQKKSNTPVVIIIIIAAVVGGCCIVSILAAIAIPNFMKFQARSKQSECRSNLRAIYTAEQSYKAEKGAFSADFAEIGVRVERGNRYAYYLSKTSVQPADTARHPQAAGEDHLSALAQAGVAPNVEEQEFLAACVGNVDRDETLDVWTVSNVERQGPEGKIPAGTPSNDLNDVRE